MTASTQPTRRSQSASPRRSFWSWAGLFDKRDRWLDSLQAIAGGGITPRRRFHLDVEQLETRELLSFTAGDLVVARIGTGTGTLSTASTAAFLDDYNTTTLNQAAPATTVALPTADAGATHALTTSGNNVTDALLLNSTDGYYLTLAGYDSAPGVSGISGVAGVNRVVGLINNAGTVNTSTILSDSYGKAVFRAAITTDDQNFWTVGTGAFGQTPGGVRYVALGSAGTSTSVSTTYTSAPYSAQISGGQLYITGSQSGLDGVAAIGTGLPTTPGQVGAALPGFPSVRDASGNFPNIVQFQFGNSTTIYTADARTDGNGGVSKWTFSGGTWNPAIYNTSIGTGPGSGLIGLVGNFGGGSSILYGTTTSPSSTTAGANSIVKIVDSGSAFSITTLATAPSNEMFRGLAFAPTPGIATTTTGMTSNATVNPGTPVVFTATVTPASPTPVGSVTFYDNGTPLPSGTVSLPAGSNVATYGTSTLAIGTNVITMLYSGGSSAGTNFIPSSSAAFTETVNGPVFTSFNNTAFSSGVAGQTFQVTSTTGVTYGAGLPAPPAWVNISSAGVISGTPPAVTQTTPSTFGVTTTDSGSITNTQSFTLYDVPTAAAPAAFTPGDLLVYRVGGDGTTYGSQGSMGSVADVSTNIYLDEYAPNGTFVETVSVPANSTSGAVDSISAINDGMMELSADGRLVTFTGIKANPGVPQISNTSSTGGANERVIGTVSGLGAVTTNTTTTSYGGSSSTASNIQSAVSVNGTQFWAAGAAAASSGNNNSGVHYYPTAGLGDQAGTITNNTTGSSTFAVRAVSIYPGYTSGGELYWDTNSTFGAGTGVYTESVQLPAPPSTPPTVSSKVGPGGDPNPAQFAIVNMDGGTTLDSTSLLYVVDNSPSLPGFASGLYRASYSGGLWTTLTLIANNITNVNGLTATVSGSNIVLYGTTASNSINTTTSFSTSIITLTDPNGIGSSLSWQALPNPVSFSDAGSTASPITQFRGIAFVPQARGPVNPNLAITVTANPPPTGSNPTNVKRSEDVTLNANLSAQTGWVSFLQAGTTVATVPISSGTASYTIPANTLPIGLSTFTVFYGGSNTFTTATQSITLNATAIQTTLTVTGPSTPHVGSVVALKAALTFSGTGPSLTGTVLFTDNASTLGSASVTFSSATGYTATLSVTATAIQQMSEPYFTPGLHGIQATYSGDANFANSTGVELQTVEANPFGAGDLLVYRNGDGINPLNSGSGGNAIFVDEYTTAVGQAAPVQSIAFPTMDIGTTHSLIADSQQSPEGQLTLSGSGQYLYLTGYDAAPNTTTQLHFASATLIPRTVGRIKYDGTVDSGVALTDLSSGGGVNGVYSLDGSSFYAAGNVGEVRYDPAYTDMSATQTSTQIDTGVNGNPINIEGVHVFGDQLYVASNNNAFLKFGLVGSGTPTSSGQNITPVANIPLGNSNTPDFPIDFYMTKLNPTSPGPDTLYLSDDGSSFSNGTITKWTLNPTTGMWSQTGEIDASGIGAIPGFYWIQGQTTGSTVTLYVTWGNGGNGQTGPGELYSLTDTSGYGGTLSNSTTVNVLASVSGSSNENFRGVALVPTAPAPVAQFNIVAPFSVTAGQSFNVTVSALDGNGNFVPAYNGTVHLTTTNGKAILPATATLTNGIGSFTATLKAAGNSTITANDIASTLTITSGTIIVNPAPPNHYFIQTPSIVQQGLPFTFSITVQDQYYNTNTGYTGTVLFLSSDSGATLPPNSTLTNGKGIFSATLVTSGGQTITAYDTVTDTITGLSAPIALSNPATHFVVTAPSAATAGNIFVFGVTALDQSNNTATGYAGTVHFTSSDSQAVFSSSNATLTSGVGFFAATLKTVGAGSQTLSAADTATPSISGASGPIAVTAAPANHFIVTAAALPSFPGVPGAYPPSQSPAPASSFATTGTPVVFSVVAQDPFGNIDHNYLGTVGFASTDTSSNVTLPANSTLTSGVGIFNATLETAGSQFITASDVSTPSIAGTAAAIVTRGLVVTSFTPTPTGFIINFNKPFNPSTVLMYSEGSTPDDIMLATTGSQVSIRGSVLYNSPTAPTSITFVKTNLASAVGTFNPATGLLAAGNYSVTLRSFSAGNGFEDSLGGALDGKDQANPGVNYVYTFAVVAPATSVGIPDFARGPSNTDFVFLPTSIGNGNTFNLIYTNPNTSPATGTATVVFSTIAATLQANIQAALNALPQIGVNGVGAPNAPVVVQNSAISTQGANVLVTFQNSYFVTATSQVLSSSFPTAVTYALANINAPNNVTGNGIPVALSNGQNVTSGSFTLQYNPTLLTITGGSKGAALTASGGTFTVTPTINNATSATAVISFSSPTKISSTTASLTLGSLLATVPFSATASYGAKQLLHFSSEQLNTTASSNIAVTNQDAVEVAAFFGDVNDTGAPFASSGAVGAISTVAGLVPSTVFQTLPGFTLFQDLDPVIIGGVSQSGQAGIVGNDTTIMNKQLTTGQPSIPFLPAGLTVNTIGPDPSLSMPTDLVASPGGTVIVPVNIDTARPEGSSGMEEAVLALTYDPKVFEVSAADVQLGTVPGGGSGWQLKTEVNSQTGLIGVELSSSTAIQSSVGGSLVTIAMHVRQTAPVGTTGLTLVPYVDPAGGAGVYQTSLLGAEGEFILHPAQTPAGPEPGAPGLVTIAAQAPVEGGSLFVSQAEPPASRALALAVVEEVFAGLAETAQVVQGSALVQPGVILNSESNDQAQTNMVRDLALVQASAGVSQAAEWLPGDWLALLGQTARPGLLASPTDPMDGAAEDADLAGLEAFFTRLAGEGDSSRTP